MDEAETAPSPKRKSAVSMAISGLIVGLVIGLPIGYLVAPAPSPGVPANTIVLTGTNVHLSVLAGPGGAFDFSIGGLENPTLQVRSGTQITVHFANIDPAVNHSMSVLSVAPTYPAVVEADPAFAGAETPDAHMGTMSGENATFTFTASTAGTYYYICHVAGHATAGMYGKFLVTA